MVLTLTNCRTQDPDLTEVEIEWELISNTFSEQPRTKAEFTISNNSDFRFIDGEEPPRASMTYHEPVQVEDAVKLKAFDVSDRSSRTVVLD